MELTGGDHRKLCKFELSELELQHPDIGAMMAQRWKLPEELVIPVKYHERPSAGPNGPVGDLTRVVGLGGILADALMSTDPITHQRRYQAKAKDWFALTPEQADAVLAEVTAATREMAKLFDIDAGAIPDPDALLSQARNQAVTMAAAAPAIPDGDDGLDALLLDSPRYDQVTGLVSEAAFPKLLTMTFDAAVQSGESLSAIRLGLEFTGPTPPGTVQANKVIVGLATLLKKHFEHRGGVIARLGPTAFIAVINAGRQSAVRAAEAFRLELETATKEWGTPAVVSVGLASRDAATEAVLTKPALLQAAATQALKAAANAGGNCVKAFTPKAAA
jgi:GGDEF domain-containing protein